MDAELQAVCARPRVANRAKCHIPPAEEEFTITTDDPAAEFDALENDEEALEDTLNLFKRHNADLRYGDIIVFPHLAGYRNDGKMIYDGEHIIPLDHEIIDDYGAVPPEFQILNPYPGTATPVFGPKYWSDIIEHNRSFPFDFTTRLPGMTVNNVTRLDGHSILNFNGLDGRVYSIVEDEPNPAGGSPPKDSVASAQEFLDKLGEKAYLDWAYSPTTPGGRATGEGGDLPASLDAERILLLPDY